MKLWGVSGAVYACTLTRTHSHPLTPTHSGTLGERKARPQDSPQPRAEEPREGVCRLARPEALTRRKERGASGH